MQQQILEAGLQHVVSTKAAHARGLCVPCHFALPSLPLWTSMPAEPSQAATLALQKELGWSEAALMEGARDLGLSPAAASMLERGPAQLVEVRAMAATMCRLSPPSGRLNVYSLFRSPLLGAAQPRALDELVRHLGLSTSSSMLFQSPKPCTLQLHNDRSFWQLVQQLEQSHSVLSVMKTPERIKAGVRMRLEMNVPYIGAALPVQLYTIFRHLAACRCMPDARPLRLDPGVLERPSAVSSKRWPFACRAVAASPAPPSTAPKCCHSTQSADSHHRRDLACSRRPVNRHELVH